MEMGREKLEGLLIDYIDGRLNAVDQKVVEQEIMNNPEARVLYDQFKEVMGVMDQSDYLEPSASLKPAFDSLLQEEIATSAKGKQIFFRPVFYRAAAAIALLVVGVALGYWVQQYRYQQDQIHQLAVELKQTKELMLSRLENEQSPSQRILGVRAAQTLTRADDEIVQAIIHTMDNDPNSNVRLAAVDALKKFRDEAKVRKALIASLSKQTDPVVQIALIQLLVEMKEKGAVKPLQKIIEDETVLDAVKDEAHAGIFKLS